MNRFAKITLLCVILCLLLVISVTAQEDMTQANKDTIQNALSELSSGNAQVYFDLFSDPFLFHGSEESPSNTIEIGYGLLTNALPDLHVGANIMIAQGDWVAAELSFRGTYTNGIGNAQPTGETVRSTELDFWRLEDGQIVEYWTVSNPMILQTQLGLMPASDDEDPSASVAMANEPLGYELLSADELAATFTTGMEERNASIVESLLSVDMAETNPPYTNPYISREFGSAKEDNPGENEPDPMQMLIATAMPDVSREFAVIVAEGDWVAYVINLNGTFTGEVNMGPDMTLTPTGQPINWQVAFIDRFNTDGEIVEEWFAIDPSPLIMGLGLMDMGGE